MTQSTRDERLRRLYETTRRPLLAYAVRRTASPEDAADVVAETFVIAMRRLDDIPEGEMELLWLYGTARGVVANFKRRAQLRSRATQQVGALGQRVAAEYSEAPHLDALMAAEALAALDEPDRELLMLAAWEGLSSMELACVLNCSPTAARIRLHRARARLRANLGERALPRHQPQPHGASTAKEVDGHERNAAAAPR